MIMPYTQTLDAYLCRGESLRCPALVREARGSLPELGVLVAEAVELSQLETPSSLQLRLQMFSFTDLEMEDVDTLKASLRMFKDLGLTRKFKLEHKTLCRWLLTVKKNYRTEVAYHNWRHAFQVAQVTWFLKTLRGLQHDFYHDDDF